MTELWTPAVDDELPLLPPELLETLSDDELAAYIEATQVCARHDGAWNLQPKQQQAEDLCDRLMGEGDVFELLYGGSAGGGKSIWLLWHLYHNALRFPGFSGMLFRRTYGELQKTAIDESWRRFDTKRATYNATHRRWTFDNGSMITFGYVDSDRDVHQFDGWEGDVLAWDELTTFPTDYPYRYMFSRLRTSIAKSVQGLVPHVIAGTNPHRSGVAWVKPRWIDDALPLEVHVEETTLDSGEVRRLKRVFVPAKLADNKYINADAYRQGLAMLDAATRKALEDGNWDVIEGAYFPEFDREVHVIAPFEIPSWWRRIGGYDFGIAAPAAHLWCAFDGDGTAYFYREFYARNMTLPEQAAAIKGAEGPGERIDYRVADPSIFNRSGAGPPIASQFVDLGLPFRRANNARVDGWARLRGYLRPSVRWQESEGSPVILKPRMFIFSTCPNFIRTLPLLVHSDKNPEDCDSAGDDHLPDCIVGETLVATARGEISMCDVRIGDNVLTLDGWCAVSDHWIVSESADVVRVTMDDDRKIICTPNHRVWVVGRGWVDAGVLRCGDRLLSCPSSISSSSQASSSGAIPRAPIARDGDTSRLRGRVISLVASAVSTKRSGRPRTVLSLPAITFIIATATRSITRSTTSSVSLARSTWPRTAVSVRLPRSNSMSFWPRLRSGIARRKAEPGTQSTHWKLGGIVNPNGGSASTVGPDTRASARTAGSVPLGVGARGGIHSMLTTWTGRASCVVRRFAATATSRPDSAPIRVARVTSEPGRRRVYDLTVDGPPEFFANGVLVHNSCRYLLMSRPLQSREPVRDKTPEELREERIRARVAERTGSSEEHPILGTLSR